MSVGLELREHLDLEEPGVHKVVEREIDDPESSTGWNSGFRAIPRQWLQARAFTVRKNHRLRKHTNLYH